MRWRGQAVGPPGVEVVRAQRLEFVGQAAQVGEMQEPVLVAQGQRQQAAAGRVLQVVGEGAEAIDVDEAVHHPPTVAQLAQGTDAQAAERQHAARPQDPPRLGQDRREVGAPLDGQAGEQQVATAVAQRQPLASPPMKWLAPPRARACRSMPSAISTARPSAAPKRRSRARLK